MLALENVLLLLCGLMMLTQPASRINCPVPVRSAQGTSHHPKRPLSR